MTANTMPVEFWTMIDKPDSEIMDTCYNKLQEATDTYERRKYFNLMVRLYNKSEEIRKVWDFIENARLLAKRFVKKVVEKVKTVFNRNVEYVQDVRNDYPEGTQLVYLIRLLDCENGLVWSKVGTTTRTMKKRMQEHLRYYKKFGVAKIEVTRIYDCGEYPAEGLESEFRAKYMRKYPGAFRKNDRFTGVEFDLAEADTIVQEYLNK